MVEALRYKAEGRGFDSRWGQLNFSLTSSFPPHYGTGVDTSSNRNKYQEYFLGSKGGRCVGLTTVPQSCASVWKFWERQHPGTLRACPGLYRERVFQVRIQLELPVNTATAHGLHGRGLLEELGDYQCIKHGTVYINPLTPN